MSFPAPALSPEINVGDPTSLPGLLPPSPGTDEVTPPAPATTLPISVPSLPPVVAPPLPASSPLLSPPLPTPTLSPTSQPQPQPQPKLQPRPQPQPQPQPPLSSPPPTATSIPPPERITPPKAIPPTPSKPININPPKVISPTPSKPINIKPPQKETPPKKVTSPSNIISPPLSKPTNIKPPPPTSTPTVIPSPPSTPASSRPPVIRPAAQPTPSKAATPTTPTPPSPLPASAALPSSPPVALPVPQTPGGGAWIPFSSESPAPLPLLPGPPGTLSSPAAPLHDHGSNNGGLVSSSSSDHQNIQAAAVEPKGSNNGASGFVVGLAVGGILLLLLGVVFGILFVFCRRKEKKFGGYGSGRKHSTLINEYEEKGSLPLHTKQGSNNTQGLQSVITVSTPKGPNMDTSGNSPRTGGPTSGIGHALSSGTFTYEELLRATNGFSEQNMLGQGGFGYVFKGNLPNGKEVAVKQLKMGGHQGEREFMAEVETISQVHHKHLVSLVGYCISGSERLLVYEFVPNNTLDFHLHGEGQPVMDWPTRLKIAIGSAKGLSYLHEDCSPTIIHRDIKAANILLDFNHEAKVSDFGLAKIFSSTNPSITHMTTRVVGTFGYLAPEYASSGKVTDKSDIYSYGVMLLELITGRPPISNFGTATCGSLVNWARPLLAQAIGEEKFDTLADPKLQDNYDIDEMSSMVACAAACVRLSAWRRPRMSQVVRSLEGNLSASELDDGIRPGQSSMHFPNESLDFDARNYMEDMKRMALTSNTTTPSRYSENTSEYGLLPSPSSTDTSQLNYSRG